MKRTKLLEDKTERKRTGQKKQGEQRQPVEKDA